MPRSDGLARVAISTCSAVELDGAGLGRGDPEQREGDVRATGADQPGQPQHLAAPDVERDARELAGPAEVRTRRITSPAGWSWRVEVRPRARPWRR